MKAIKHEKDFSKLLENKDINRFKLEVEVVDKNSKYVEYYIYLLCDNKKIAKVYNLPNLINSKEFTELAVKLWPKPMAILLKGDLK